MPDHWSGRNFPVGDDDQPQPGGATPWPQTEPPALPRDPVDAFAPPDAPFGDATGTAAEAEAPVDTGTPADAPTPAWAPDPYADVPASLELSYGAADLGLSPHAYEKAFPYERRQRHASGIRVRRIGRELIETVVLAVLIFFAVKAVVQNFRVEGASMEPSLHNEQYLLVNKAIYFRVDMDKVHSVLPFIPGDDERHLFRAPRRGDVVVFRFHLDPSRDFIKRVIGVPGDTVEVKDGTVFINGALLQEDYILAAPNYTYGPKTVPEGHYFVLGDNRRNSFDSHAWGQNCPPQQQCDFVPEENIIGQAWVSYWPIERLEFINNKSLKPSAP